MLWVGMYCRIQLIFRNILFPNYFNFILKWNLGQEWKDFRSYQQWNDSVTIHTSRIEGIVRR